MSQAQQKKEREVRRLPYVDPRLLRKVKKAMQENDQKPIKTWSRSCTIVPEFVGLVLAIHNGRKHIAVMIKEEMVGKKLGEFSPTRTFKGHGSNRK
ncbi:30S ribosomal protein S19 [Candidatus Fokinia crypta]|uniref:Small ribosomal subunit protein uS19 n=1 Tax=Candidatus Fokinia crypta TaxID=1920990 RepID=A0ABZ0UNL6_9RICK|nr:30S ribosomal protein S19 [Candidatus Fokinia cryptica]WPX97718.1 30S ribosomal protein S19 [Candidatus Fokinia cryptica]